MEKTSVETSILTLTDENVGVCYLSLDDCEELLNGNDAGDFEQNLSEVLDKARESSPQYLVLKIEG